MAAHEIKHIILKLTFRRAQSNMSIVVICVSCAENDYYRAVTVGQPAARTASAAAVCKAIV